MPTAPARPAEDVDRLAHDLRTAIAVAKGNAQMLQRYLGHPDAPDRARIRAGLERIDSALTAAAGAIDALARRASAARTRPD
jgi:signal transduction histidine kinase